MLYLVLVLMFVAVALVATAPRWLGRSWVRYKVWALRDEIFDELYRREITEPVMWGLVRRSEMLANVTGHLTPVELAFMPVYEVPESDAFPAPARVAALPARELALYERWRDRLEKLAVTSLIFTSWSGLVVGAVLRVYVATRRGTNVASEMQDRAGDRPDRIVASVGGGQHFAF